MFIDKKHFFFAKTNSVKPVLIGATFYLTTFFMCFHVMMKGRNYVHGYYRYKGLGLGLSVTLFDHEFTLKIIPFVDSDYKGDESKVATYAK